MRRYYLDLFGCAKNQVDAENMTAYLNSAGWESAKDAGSSDLIIVNSCGFIESAKQESINAVLEWRKIFPGKKILLAGCLAQRYAKELPEILTEADSFFGVDNPAEIAEKAAGMFSEKSTRSDLKENKKLPGQRPLLSLPGSAYVKISEGCDNHCSYCAIPLIRGRLVSRDVSGIVDECRSLLSRNIKELCIIGQDIGAFDSEEFPPEHTDAVSTAKAVGGRAGLPELLEAISELRGKFWVRLLYIHPDHFPPRILDLMEKDSRFIPYFDIPFQHASAKILAAMNRNRTAKAVCTAKALSSSQKFAELFGETHEASSEKYLTLINAIRGRLPGAVIRSTFLSGFPGETEEDFSALLDFQKKANLDWLGCFSYSREEGTASYSMKGRVPAKTAVMRKKIIEERQIQITEKNMDRFINTVADVLLEEKIDSADSGGNGEYFWLGRTYWQAPDIDGSTVIVCGKESGKDLQAGEFIKCRITARRGIDMEAMPNLKDES